MTTAETTPLQLNALADDAELYGEGCREYAQGLRAAAIELEAAIEREGRLRVVPVEPSEADVERVARAIFAHEWQVSVAEIEAQHPHEWKSMRDYWTAHARAALRAFLAGGGDE